MKTFIVKILNFKKITFLLVVFAFCFSTAAPNEIPQSSTTGNNLKKKTLTFEDELIEGGAQKPELFYLLQQKNFNYKRLIKLRENFIPEMRRTAEDVQRIRGGR